MQNADLSSKSHSQGELNLAGRIGVGDCKRARWNLEMSGEVIDSKLVTYLYKVCRVALQAVFGDLNQLIIPVEQVERLDDQIQFHAIPKLQAAGKPHVGGSVVRAEK